MSARAATLEVTDLWKCCAARQFLPITDRDLALLSQSHRHALRKAPEILAPRISNSRGSLSGVICSTKSASRCYTRPAALGWYHARVACWRHDQGGTLIQAMRCVTSGCLDNRAFQTDSCSIVTASLPNLGRTQEKCLLHRMLVSTFTQGCPSCVYYVPARLLQAPRGMLCRMHRKSGELESRAHRFLGGCLNPGFVGT